LGPIPNPQSPIPKNGGVTIDTAEIIEIINSKLLILLYN
jgi:hypothetical protein